MAKRRIEVDIVANDRASSIFAKVKNNASGMASHLTTALDGSVKFEKSLRNYNSAMYNFNRVVGSVMRTAGDSIYNFTKDAINNFSELERQHAKTMGAMATDYAKTAEAQAKFLADSEKLKQQAIQIGSYGTNGKGALNTVTDVSYAQTALIKSGLSAEDILDTDVVESILKFAGGNDLDVDTATTFAVNLGTVFDKPIEEWGNMLDMITKAADISVIDVQDIMDSLTYTGGIASGLGRDLEEVLGVIAVMGQAGLRGRVAGTGLQAFFTRILSAGELSAEAAGNAPTDYVAQIYDAFTSEAVNADGSFKDMDEVAALLDTAMDSLNDQEQAWFAKKLFGLYQMKAAYALTGAVDGDKNLITDFIDQITNQSAGANDIKYELMQGSQYGKITSLKNAWEGIKTDFGDKMSPVVSAVADELLAFLSNDGNYDINWDKLYKAFEESGDLIGAKYGEEIGKAVENIGSLGLDAAQITGAMLPYAGGIINGIALLLQGDVSGALEAFCGGLEDTNEEIEELPPELQGSAKAARNVISAFTTLASVNLATQIAQIITTAFNTFLGKPMKIALARITSSQTTLSSPTNTVVNANYVQVNTSTATVQAGTATAVNIGSVPLMNVTATVVNVYGGSGFNIPGSGGGGTPLLPLLGAGAAGGLLGSGIKGLLGSGGSAATGGLLGSGTSGVGGMTSKWLGADSAVLNADGSVAARYWGGKSASQIIGSAGRVLGLAGVLTYTATNMTSSSIDWETIYRNALTEGTDAGYDNEELRQYLIDYFNSRNGNSEWAATTYDAQLEMYTRWLTTEGATQALNDIKAELDENGKLSEEFLRSLVTNEGSTGGTYSGTQKDLEFLLSVLFNKEYDTPWLYLGSFAQRYTTNFVEDALENGNLYDLSSLASASGGVSGIVDVLTDIETAIGMLQSPSITVNVTTNVDKSGNATSTASIDNMSRSIARRSSQYGQTYMIS